MSLILPEKYQPKHARETVEVAVVPEEGGLAISKQRAEEVAAELRMYVLNSSMVKEIETLGVQVETIGSNRSANGFTLLSNQLMATVMLKLVDKLNTGGDAHEVAASLSKLANALTKSNAILKKGADEMGKRNRPPPVKFTPGQPIQPAVQVNVQVNNSAGDRTPQTGYAITPSKD